MPDRVAYIPLNTYPEAAPDDAILGAISFAGALGCKVHVSTFAVEFLPVPSPIGGVSHQHGGPVARGGRAQSSRVQTSAIAGRKDWESEPWCFRHQP